MIIKVTTFKDGKAVVVDREVPDDYFGSSKTPAELREEAYNTEAVIPWDGDMLTVTAASQLWQYYAAEGNVKASELQELIAAAKAEIRLQYPDEEVGV